MTLTTGDVVDIPEEYRQSEVGSASGDRGTAGHQPVRQVVCEAGEGAGAAPEDEGPPRGFFSILKIISFLIPRKFSVKMNKVLNQLGFI